MIASAKGHENIALGGKCFEPDCKYIIIAALINHDSLLLNCKGMSFFFEIGNKFVYFL